VAVAVFVVGLVANFPARLAFSWFAPANVELVQPQGSVWSGDARQLILNGTGIDAVSWRTAFWPLFRGRLSLSLAAKPGGGLLSANTDIGFGGSVHVSAFRASIAIQALQSLIPLVGISGTLTMTIDDLSLSQGALQSIRGSVMVAGLRSRVVSSDSLGDYLVEIQSKDGGIIASVEDRDGILDVAGTVTVSSAMDYQFLGQIAETANTPPDISEKLAVLGTPNERGQRTFRFEGSL
jgi:hypothetical protein